MNGVVYGRLDQREWCGIWKVRSACMVWYTEG